MNGPIKTKQRKIHTVITGQVSLLAMKTCSVGLFLLGTMSWSVASWRISTRLVGGVGTLSLRSPSGLVVVDIDLRRVDIGRYRGSRWCRSNGNHGARRGGGCH